MRTGKYCFTKKHWFQTILDRSVSARHAERDWLQSLVMWPVSLICKQSTIFHSKLGKLSEVISCHKQQNYHHHNNDHNKDYDKAAEAISGVNGVDDNDNNN